MKLALCKVVSGGQTGVDRAALETAKAVGLKTGGWAPPDMEAEDGAIPPEFGLRPSSKESHALTPEVPRSERTALNVRDSDGTLILSPEPPRDLGTLATIKFAEHFQKPILVSHTFDVKTQHECAHWLKSNRIRTLNVAGPSTSNWPDAEPIVAAFLTAVCYQIGLQAS